MVIAAGFGYRAPSVVAVGLSVVGMGLAALSFATERRAGREVPPVAVDEPVSAFAGQRS